MPTSEGPATVDSAIRMFVDDCIMPLTECPATQRQALSHQLQQLVYAIISASTSKKGDEADSCKMRRYRKQFLKSKTEHLEDESITILVNGLIYERFKQENLTKLKTVPGFAAFSLYFQ